MNLRLLALSAVLTIGCEPEVSTHEARAQHLGAHQEEAHGLQLLPACPAHEAEEHCPVHREVQPALQGTHDELVSACEQWLEQAPSDYIIIQQRTHAGTGTMPVTAQVCGGAVESTQIGGVDVDAGVGTMVDLYWELAESLERGVPVHIDYPDTTAFHTAPFPHVAAVARTDGELVITTETIRPQ